MGYRRGLSQGEQEGFARVQARPVLARHVLNTHERLWPGEHSSGWGHSNSAVMVKVTERAVAEGRTENRFKRSFQAKKQAQVKDQTGPEGDRVSSQGFKLFTETGNTDPGADPTCDPLPFRYHGWANIRRGRPLSEHCTGRRSTSQRVPNELSIRKLQTSYLIH